jgi:predicted nucleic acid-binding protein
MFWHLPSGVDGSRRLTAPSSSPSWKTWSSWRAFGRILDLAREERLTAYDAAYLELAMRLGVPLASKDADLCDAAQRLGVSVLRAD